MKQLTIWTTLIVFALSFTTLAQEKKFKIHTIAFYNLENLFDTINDPTKNDEATPIMEMAASNRADAYMKKVNNMARVIADIGSDVTKNTPAVIGVCEIENREVLVDVVNNPLLVGKDYGIIHFDGPDKRSIDVALLYQKALFQPVSTSSHELLIYDDVTRNRVYTRDQLLVSGKFDGELMHFIVNHWPSRSGGEAKSRSKRVAAAKLNKRIIDSLQAIDPYAKIFTMGDFNDNPTNASFKDVLKTKSEKEDVEIKGLYNPMENFLAKGLGSNAYRDAWSLFDQIVISQPLLEKDYSSYRFYQAGIFNKNYLITKRGRWKGYPFRSWDDGGFSDGFSDHFPAYVYIIKEVE
jgi:hypothetical protein